MDRPSLSEILRNEGLFAKKSLGQHFLLDINLTSKISRLANIDENDVLFEIGPGPGGLTAALLQSPAHKIIVIEKDRRFAEHLRNYFADFGDRLLIIEGDALEIKPQDILHNLGLDTLKPKIISNLPYNVGTQLLINWIHTEVRDWPMVLMFQLEVAKRICAKTGENEYGRLAILINAQCEARIAMPISRLAFTPPPKVESAIVTLSPKPDRFDDMQTLGKITSAAFGQRRKMLRSSLSTFKDAGELLREAGIDETLRAEAVPPEGYYKLVELFNQRKN